MNSPSSQPSTDQHLAILRELHSTAAPTLPLHQRLQSEFPTETRELIIERIQKLLAAEMMAPFPAPASNHAVPYGNGMGNGYSSAIELNDIDGYVRRMRLEIATDEVLSTPQNFISHYGCLAPLIA